MEAKDVRIGNYVEYYLIDTMIPESEWKWVLNPVEISDLGDIEDETSYRPIPLTEDWIIKLGFVDFKYSVFRLGLDGDDFIYNQYTLIINKCLFMKIQYVHQLQNVVFALTGEELIIINSD